VSASKRKMIIGHINNKNGDLFICGAFKRDIALGEYI